MTTPRPLRSVGTRKSVKCHSGVEHDDRSQAGNWRRVAQRAGAARRREQAQGQDWPQRPVKLLVPFAAGGNIDIMGRIAAQRLSEALGQQFIVENRVGGNGTIAAMEAARAAPDG